MAGWVAGSCCQPEGSGERLEGDWLALSGVWGGGGGWGGGLGAGGWSAGGAAAEGSEVFCFRYSNFDSDSLAEM